MKQALETGIFLSCKWNGEELNVTRSKSQYGISAALGGAPHYTIVISGVGGLRYTEEIRIILEDSQSRGIPVADGNPAYARQTVCRALKALVLARTE
jgi:hypothetical protein